MPDLLEKIRKEVEAGHFLMPFDSAYLFKEYERLREALKSIATNTHDAQSRDRAREAMKETT